MACLIFSHSEIVCGLRGCVCIRIASQDITETGYRLLETILIELNLAFAKHDLGNEIIRREIAHESMVLVAIGIQDDDGWSPFDSIALHRGSVLIEVNLDGNEIALDSKTDIRIGVSNSCQLLTPDSKIIIEVHQNQFLSLFCLCLRLTERGFPLDLFFHNHFSFHSKFHPNPYRSYQTAGG